MSDLCAACGLDVAAHRVVRGGRVYCTDYCGKSAAGDVVGEAGACAPIVTAPTAEADPRAELDGIVAQLGPDEVKVLVAISRRLAMGRRVYGTLDIAGDRRDWKWEATDEALDLAVYLSAELLRRR